MAILYPRGSEWRKWDLHIHTPASILNNGFGDNWDLYVKRLYNTLINKEIAVVGITDYFTIDGYKKIKNEYLANDSKLKSLFSEEQIAKIRAILVLPNIEFRSNVFVGPTNSVNFHVIFSNEVLATDIEEHFLHEVDFYYESEPQGETTKRKLTEANLRALGIRLKSEHSEFSSKPDLLVGMMNAVVDQNEITKILFNKKSIFSGKYMLAVEADGDLSAIHWDSRSHHTRKVLIQGADILLSSNAKTRNWGLGRPPYMEGAKNFIKEFISLKPCVNGSDAHEFNFIGHPCAKRGIEGHNCSSNSGDCELRICWIKADPTFEGLKQIICEPEERIAIQSNDPTSLRSAQTISAFDIAAATLEPELKFRNIALPINGAFIAITGGKGSGKTALVDLLANMYENRAYCEDNNSFVRRISDGEYPKELKTTIKMINNYELTKEVKSNLFMEGYSIVYVAQGELEKHVDNPELLEAYINQLIFDSPEVRDSELFFDYDSIKGEIIELKAHINASNSKVYELENETAVRVKDALNKEIKEQGTILKDIDNRIQELSKKIGAIKVKEAEEKQKELGILRDRKTHLFDLGLLIKEALRFIEEDIISFNAQVDRINLLAERLKFPERFKSVELSEAARLRTFISSVRDELKKTIGEIEKFQKELEEKERGIKEHAKLLDKQKELEKGIKQLFDKLKIIEGKGALLRTEKKNREELYNILINKKLEQRDKYLGIIDAFSANKSDILNDLEFTAELTFDQVRFLETMSELVDHRRIRIMGTPGTESDISFFLSAMADLVRAPDPEKVRAITSRKMEELLGKIVQNQKRAETLNRRIVYDSVFGDYISVAPSVKYKKVRLSKLSIGQKATVLIKIYLGKGENPIVIDSHDDHLDNESIMEELVKAIRQAKQFRQILFVSNNGNVVVNSDAEQVVIASRNDEGEISYISGSLENPALRLKLLGVLEGGEEAFSRRREKYRLAHN